MSTTISYIPETHFRRIQSISNPSIARLTTFRLKTTSSGESRHQPLLNDNNSNSRLERESPIKNTRSMARLSHTISLSDNPGHRSPTILDANNSIKRWTFQIESHTGCDMTWHDRHWSNCRDSRTRLIWSNSYQCKMTLPEVVDKHRSRPPFNKSHRTQPEYG
jgi:hypothetical protein